MTSIDQSPTALQSLEAGESGNMTSPTTSPLHSPTISRGSIENVKIEQAAVSYTTGHINVSHSESVVPRETHDVVEIQGEVSDTNIIIPDNQDVQQYTIASPGSGGDMMGAVSNSYILTSQASQDGEPVIMVGGDGTLSPPGQRLEIEVKPEQMLCMVCSDKGSGYHYSVYSCEGCKGFFKRSVQKNLNYVCKENKNCTVNKYTRNNCQYCRFMKCLDAGMKREAVREDRTPGGGRHGKGGKRPRLEDSPNYISSIINNISSDPGDDVMIQKLIDAKPDLIPSASDLVVDGSSTSNVDINMLMQYGYMELRLIIEWARKVPGFADLLIEDQMALLKGSFMELNVLRLAYRSLNCEGGVKFAQGLVLTPEQSTDIGWGHDLTNCSLEFISKLKEIHMDDTEYCILNAIVLTFPDATGVRDKDSVINLQNKILDSLRKYTVNKYPNEPRRYGRMLLRLPALRTVSAIAAERFLSMSLDGNIKMNALVLEMMS